ncbi:MAG TPA: hypothetical protein VF655_00735 [Allosphingosinicella sp.]
MDLAHSLDVTHSSRGWSRDIERIEAQVSRSFRYQPLAGSTKGKEKHMRVTPFAFLILLIWQVPAPLVAQEPEIVVRGDVARSEIERIVEADNLDTSKLSPREVADAITLIPRRRAPADFWVAYLAHVEAWRRLAEATGAARRNRAADDFEAVAAAEDAVDTTFDEVERIARGYGARLPIPAARRLPTI